MDEETAKSIAKSLERIAKSLETFVAHGERGLGFPVQIFQSDTEGPLKVAVENDKD